jgi:hypothetical protein
MALSLSRQCKHFTLTNFFEKREKLYKEKKLKAYAHHQVSPFLGGWGQEYRTASWPHHTHTHGPHPHRRSASAGQKNQLPQPKQRSPKPKQDTKTSKTTAKGVKEKKKLTQNPPASFPPLKL